MDYGPPYVYMTSRFTWSKACRTFCAEASDLDWDGTSANIRLISSKTSAAAEYHYHRTDYDAENEVLGWVFLPTEATLERHPQLNETSLVIFND